MTVPVPIIDLKTPHLQLANELKQAVERVLLSGQYVLGPEVERFEEAFAAYTGSRAAVAVNSGTDALALTLKSLGIGTGQEVVTVPNSFAATVGAIRQVGADVRFVDVGSDENLDPEILDEAIGSRTAAIIPVHLHGRPARMKRILEIASRHGIPVIEDVSQAHGAELYGKRAGSFGKAGCFSLHPQKILGAAGDAGVVTTDDVELAERLKLIRNHGLRNRDRVDEWGFNSRLDELQAAVLNVKMQYLDLWIARHREIAGYYSAALAGMLGRLPMERPEEVCVYYHYSLMVPSRDEFLTYLQRNGIDARVHYPLPLHLQPAAKGFGQSGICPEAVEQARRQISLPIFAAMTDEQVEAVIAQATSYYWSDRSHAMGSAVTSDQLKSVP